MYRPRTQCAPSPDTDAISRAVETEVRHFLSAHAPATEDDLRQEAWRIALEAAAAPTRDPDRPLAPYVRRAIRLSLPQAIGWAYAVVHVSKHVTARASDYADRTDVDVLEDERTDTTPEREVVHAETASRVRGAVLEVIGGLTADLRPLARRLYLGQSEPTPAEVAEEFECDVALVYRARARFVSAARLHPVLRAAYEQETAVELEAPAPRRRRPARKPTREQVLLRGIFVGAIQLPIHWVPQSAPVTEVEQPARRCCPRRTARRPQSTRRRTSTLQLAFAWVRDRVLGHADEAGADRTDLSREAGDAFNPTRAGPPVAVRGIRGTATTTTGGKHVSIGLGA